MKRKMKRIIQPKQPNSKKHRAFIGCTKEAQYLAEAIQSNLASWCYPELWSHGFFTLSKTTIESLENGLPNFGFAVFLLTPDDISIVKGKRHPAARDNLILEVGMAIGLLGRSHTFIVVPKDSGLKLPTDILGVTYAEYDSSAPNFQAAFAPACNKIRDAFEQSLARPIDLVRTHFGHSMQYIHPHHLGESDALISHVSEMVFSKGVLRRNWTIDLSYDFAKIDKNIITEKIIWDYEFINITTKRIDYPITLFSLIGDINTLVSFTKMESNGNRVPVFTSGDTNVEQQRLFLKRQRVVPLPPSVSHFITMQFLLDHPVSPQAHYIHNAFAPIEPTLSTRLKVFVPNGYRMDVLGIEGIEPIKLGDQWDFRIPTPLLPEQIIEYIFQKEDFSNEHQDN